MNCLSLKPSSITKFLQKLKVFKFSSKKPSVPLPFKDLSLREKDEEIYDLLEREKRRQWAGLELIPSENYVSKSMLECLGSILTNKYSEGYPGARYYGGNEFIDKIENIARTRALNAFNLNVDDWGVNVQSYSGSPANFAVYTALASPGDKIMGMHLYSGGHLTHGFKTGNRKVSATSVYFESDFYRINENTGMLEMEEVAKKVREFKPKILIVGASAYPRDFDYSKFRGLADEVGAYLLGDISHISGLVATKELNNPFEYCDVISTTTHKTLRGPRAGMIFYNKRKDPSLDEKINFSVFPMLQGGPHNHQIASIATQMKEVITPEFKEYCQQVKKNAKALAKGLLDRNHKLISGGTDNHLLLWDVRPHELTGSKVEKASDLVHVTVNKNTIVGDKSAMTPGGIRIGTPAITTRGMVEKDMDTVAEFLSRVCDLSVDVQKKEGKNLRNFTLAFEKDDRAKLLKKEVEDFSTQFYIPGIDVEQMKYFY